MCQCVFLNNVTASFCFLQVKILDFVLLKACLSPGRAKKQHISTELTFRFVIIQVPSFS